MKNVAKKLVSMFLAVCMVVTVVGILPGMTQKVEAARETRFFQHDPVAASPDGTQEVEVLSIINCSKKSEIKNLKSSNNQVVKVEAKDGYVRAVYGKNTGTATISCKVRGKKIATKFIVKKYQNPLSSFKIGSNQFSGKLNHTTAYTVRNFKGQKKQTITWKARKGWKIKYYFVSCKTKAGYVSKMYTGNALKSSVTLKNITFGPYDHLINVTCYNSKTKVTDEVKLWHYAD